MTNKILKKILGIFNFKLIDKNYFKNTRLISHKSFLSLEQVIEEIFKKEIRQLIQIGANDGNRFDTLNKYIKKNKTNSILIEPIKKNFDDLKENYKECNFVKVENLAISINNEISFLYKVDEKFLNLYDSHIPGITSFDRNHLIKHGVKRRHISKEKVTSNTIEQIINKYKLTCLDLLFIDTEGYDGKLVLDFLKIQLFTPIIIFEYIHINNYEFSEVIEKLLSSQYKFFSINENLICLPKNEFLTI